MPDCQKNDGGTSATWLNASEGFFATLTKCRLTGSLVLKAAHDAEEFYEDRARESPSWPGGDLRGRIR
jgi:hypothetical protein